MAAGHQTFRVQAVVVAAALIAVVAAIAAIAHAATGNISTVAGTGSGGFSGDTGPATAAQLEVPTWVETTDDGGYLITDQGNSRVRRVSPSGTITTLAGTGGAGLSGTNGLAELPDGSILIADSNNNRVLRATAGGTITIVAGGNGAGFSGDNGPAIDAKLNFPIDLAVLPDGGYLIADNDNHRVRRVAPDGTITTLAGTGTPGGAGEGMQATNAQLNNPAGLALTGDGGFLVTEQEGARVRRVHQDGTITRVAGTGVPGSDGDAGPATAAKLNFPSGIAATVGGGFVVSEFFGHRLRQVSPAGTITTLAGTGVAGFGGDSGPAGSAQLNTPSGLALNSEGDVIVADVGNDRVRLVDIGDPPVEPPPEEPPPEEPPQVTDVETTQAPAPGQPAVLTAEVSGDADRIEWDVDGDGKPDIFGGADQTSLRFRPPPGKPLTVNVQAIGPAGEGSMFAHDIAAVQAAEGKLASSLQAALGKRPPVYAVGAAVNLIQGPSQPLACGAGASSGGARAALFTIPTKVVSGSLSFIGDLAPATKVVHFPQPEQGVFSTVAKTLNVPKTSTALNTMVGLSDAFVGLDQLILNDEFLITPKCNKATNQLGSIIAFPQGKTLVSSAGNIRIGSGELNFPIAKFPSRFGVTIDPRDPIQTLITGDVRKFLTPGTSELRKALASLGGSLVGDLDFQLVDGGAQFTVNLKLPSWLGFAGGNAQARVRLRLVNGRISLDELTIGPINANVGALRVDAFKVDYRQLGNEWDGGGRVCLFGAGCVGGIVKVRNGDLDFFRADVNLRPGGIPLGTGVLLEAINFGMGRNPTRLTGGADVSFARILVIAGQMVLAFPTPDHPFVLLEDEVRGFPRHLYGQRFYGTTFGINANAKFVLPIGEVPLASAYVLYEFGGYLALGGGINYGFPSPSFALISVDGRVDGEFNTRDGRFNVDGRVQGCVAGVICKGFDGNVSSNGMSVCTNLKAIFHTFHVGGAIRWSPFLFIPYLDGCQWGRFRVPSVRAAQAAQDGEPYQVEIERGDRSRMVMLDGDGGAPSVTVSGPGGQTLASPEGSELITSEDGTIRIMRSEEGSFIAVAFADARPGTYTITPDEDSVPISEVRESTALSDARVSGKVRGSGKRRVLSYDIRRRPNQVVSFFEIDREGAGRAIGRVKGGGRGKLRFSPAPGAGSSRIEARFALDGVPAETKKVARFKPPKPRLGKPRGLRVRRKGKGLRVGWKAVKEAARYELGLTTSNRPQRRLVTRKTRAVVKRVPKHLSGRVSVRALDSQRTGQASSDKFRRTAPRPSAIEPLRRCRVKKKLTCRRG